jgi:hypothetical protein
LNRPELTPEKADATARYKKIVYQQGALDELLTEQIRKKWPQVKIILRGDGGFCRNA